MKNDIISVTLVQRVFGINVQLTPIAGKKDDEEPTSIMLND
jgi:hypothetical protein